MLLTYTQSHTQPQERTQITFARLCEYIGEFKMSANCFSFTKCSMFSWMKLIKKNRKIQNHERFSFSTVQEIFFLNCSKTKFQPCGVAPIQNCRARV